jgi:chemosensory pili system protein ChpA (sensor histidine kinase/response regulator)
VVYVRPEIDPILLGILSKETATHLTVIRDFIEECREGAPPFLVPEDVYRASHTLHGSVTMAKAEPAAKISGPLYQLIRHSFDHDVPVGRSELEVCAETANAMEVIIRCLSDPECSLPDTSELETRLRSLYEDVKAQAVMQDAEDQLEDTPHVDLGEFAEAGPEPAGLPIEGVEPPIDAEIAATFADEAAEILEGVDAVLAQPFDGQMDESAMAELQRYLHTFKGGARLAGLSGMGDLSHDLETLLLRMTRGELPQNVERLNLLQETVDELHHLSEEIANGLVENPSPQVVAKLQEALAAQAGDEVSELVSELAILEQETEVEPAADEEVEVVVEESLEPGAYQPGSLPAADQLGELARELREPPVPGAGGSDLHPQLLAEIPVPERREFVRIDSVLLEKLLNNAGEVSIFHSRLSEQMSQTEFNLEELGQTVSRLREQLRNLEMTTEAQILHQHQTEVGRDDTVDPLKLERYSKIQQLSRALGETASDVNSLKDLLQNLTSETEALLVQQARTAGELQDGLMRTRMVPFEQHTARLARLVRQMAAEHDKKAELSLHGGGDIDRQILEKMLPAFEHMLRNAVIHGIESPSEREAAGKPAVGSVVINVGREGSQVIIEIIDDGRGIDADAVRLKAVELGLAAETTDLKDEEVLRFILRSGFSTADRLTKAAGRGVGMDVVASEIAKLGGALEVDTRKGKGTTFSIRLPFTLAVTQALIVRVANEFYALPLPTVEGIIRISRSDFDEKMSSDDPIVDYGGQTYQLRHLGQYLGLGSTRIPTDQDRIPIILVRAGTNSTALVTDEMLASREIVVKSIGKQLATIRGLSGATILGDGRIVVILDVGVLVRSAIPSAEPADVAHEATTDQPVALVVDDSITMRRVTQRLLERNGMRVVTARDGLQAVAMLQDHPPDIILLDIEMPRMNGYEFATHVRNNPGTENLPIIMITSRVSDEHRARAIELGVNDFLGKPYQESALLDAVRNLIDFD